MRVAISFLIAFCLVALAIAAPRPCEHARILGATYGTKDITSAVAHDYNLGKKAFNASTQRWGSTLEGNHTLTIVYEKCGNLAVQTSLEGEQITLP